MDADMAAYYGAGEERGRLSGWGRLEFVRTQELLARHLPPPPAVVLDVGGGPGAYAVWLAERGYRVHLVDPVELHISQAEEAAAGRLQSARVGDARALPFPDASADAVLALGPLYHLHEPADREQALHEARRVLRPDGVLAAAAISRFASTFDGLFRGYMTEPAFERIVEQDLRDGRHANPERRLEWFTTAYLHLPDELREEVAGAGFSVDALVAVEGPAAFLPDVDDWLDDRGRRDTLLRAIRRVEAHPSLLGASPHILAIARRMIAR